MSYIYLEMLFPLQKLLRLKLLECYFKAGAGHIGCSLSCLDILIAAFIDKTGENDEFILSKGHAAIGLYICLNHLGEISDAELTTLYKDATRLPAHPPLNTFRHVPFALGSLGHGFPIANGMAKARKLKNQSGTIFVLMSDGETNEGTTWEAAHFASAHSLDNLLVIIDRNGIQGFDRTENVLGDTAAIQKWELMGFDVLSCDGHDLSELSFVLDQLIQKKDGRPKLLVANTVKGKGVGFMEDTIDWHYLPMSEEQYQIALEEVKKSVYA